MCEGPGSDPGPFVLQSHSSVPGDRGRLSHRRLRHVDLVVARSSSCREGGTAGLASATNEGERSWPRLIWDVTMSLDGFTSGPNVRAEEPMGDGGEGLHAWMEGDRTGRRASIPRVFDMVNTNIGGILIGRRTFDLGLKNWGGTPWPNTPSFVITHRTRDDLKGDNGGTFAFGTLEDSVRRAREAAGDEQRHRARRRRRASAAAGRPSRRDLAPHLAHPSWAAERRCSTASTRRWSRSRSRASAPRPTTSSASQTHRQTKGPGANSGPFVILGRAYALSADDTSGVILRTVARRLARSASSVSTLRYSSP